MLSLSIAQKPTQPREQIIRIFSIDPGLTSLGWSIIEYNVTNNLKTVTRFGTITGKSLLKKQKDLQDVFEKRHIIVWELEPELTALVEAMKPQFIVVEEPFAHTYISAYVALVLVVHTVRTVARKTIGRDIYLIAPKEGKKAISNDGTSGKEAVQKAVMNDPTITIKKCKQNNEDELTEHACDSIAVGVAFIQNQLPAILASGIGY